ncbi:unnamed protein product, partial [Mesorhabditis spiculigera]
MSSAWDEIKRLASDLQRVQLSAAAKKLSEANCVEVISKLIERQLIDVVFTRDGTTYITRKHLCTEYVIAATKTIIAEDDEFLISAGELFARDYVHKLQMDLRVLLSEEGVRSIASLCRDWSLSTELLRSLLLDRLQEGGEFTVDGENIYTLDFLEAHKFILRAVLCAITKATLLSHIQQRVSLPTNRFFAALDDLLSSGEVPGKIVGSRTSASAIYIPNLHGELVNAAIRRMFAQNEYILFSDLKKMGLSDVKAAVKSAFAKEEFGQLRFLGSIVVPEEVFDTQMSALKDELAQNCFVDVSAELSKSSLPFEAEDESFFIEAITAGDKDLLVSEPRLYTSELLAKAVDSLSEKLDQRAGEEMDKMDQKKKKTAPKPAEKDEWDEGGKGKGKKGKGGGAKGRGNAKKDEDDNTGSGFSLDVDEVEGWLRSSERVPEELIQSIAEQIIDKVSQSIRDRVARLVATQAVSSAQSNKRSHQQMEQQLNQLYANISLFETGLEKIPDNIRDDLRAYLQKTLCTELAHALLGFASDTGNVGQMKEKQREETIEALPSRIKDAIVALYASLREDDLQNFNNALFDLCAPSVLQLGIKNPDKKTREELTNVYATQLLAQVNEQSDPAAALLSSVLYLYAKDGIAVHASGKFVAQLVSHLATLIDVEIYDLLLSAQKLVVASFKNKGDVELKEQLDQQIQALRQRLTQG